MRFKNVIKYITRGWNDTNTTPLHPSLKIIPPFVFDVFMFLLIGSILISIVLKVFGLELE